MLLLINFSFLQQGFSQARVEWSDPYEMDDDDEEVTRYELPGKNYFTVNTKAVVAMTATIKVKLRLYNPNGKVIKTNAFKVDGNSYALVEMAGGQYYIVTRSLKFSGVTLNAFALDPAIEDRRPDGVPLSDLPFKPVGGTTMYQLSTDRTKLYVIEIPGQKKGSQEKWNLKVFDQKMNLLNTREFNINYDKDLFQLRAMKVDNNDNLVLTCFLFESPPMLIGNPPVVYGKMPPYQLLVFTLKSGSNELKEIPMSTPGAFPQQITYLDHGDNSFTCYGLYGKARQGYTSGAFTAKFNVDGTIMKPISLRAFPQEVMELASRREASKKESEAFNFNIDIVRELPNGSIEFVAEQKNDYYSSFSSSSTINGITTTTTVSGMQYMHDDILIFNLFPDPGKDWFTLLRKRQASFGDKNYLSYCYSYCSNGDIYLVYNDLEENLQVPNDDEPKNLKAGKDKMVTVLATIDQRGKMTRTILFKKTEIGHWFTPGLTKREGDILLLTATAKRTYKVGRLPIP